MKLLELTGLRARYGAADVLHGLDVTVEEGEIVALLGEDSRLQSLVDGDFHVRQLVHEGGEHLLKR